MRTWEEMFVRGGRSWNDGLFDYTSNVVSNLIIDQVNKKYGFNGGHMKAIENIESFVKRLDEKTLNVKKIIHSGPCTIVIWGDNEKTIVRKSEDDPDDEYAAFCAAFCKRFFGSTSAVKKLIDKKTVPYRPTNEEKKEETKVK